MALRRKKKQNDFEKIFDLDPEEKEKVKKEVTPEQAEKKRKRKSVFRKALVIGIPSIIVIAAAVLLIVYHINNSGYRLEIKNTLSVVFDEDATALCENMSKINYRGLSYNDYLIRRYRTVDVLLEEFVDNIRDESGVESFKDESGKPAAYKSKVRNSEKLSEEEIEDLISGSVEEGTEPSIKASEIEEVRRVDLQLTITGTKFVTEYMLYNVYLVNEGGQWKVYIDINQLDLEEISQNFPENA